MEMKRKGIFSRKHVVGTRPYGKLDILHVQEVGNLFLDIKYLEILHFLFVHAIFCCIRAHKLVLSICSTTLSSLFAKEGALANQQNPYIYLQEYEVIFVYCMSNKLLPILYSKLLYIIGHYFLDK